MAARKSIPKSIRFEVLKRDSFTCQYCGAQAPETILEVDHIVPVSKGGDNSILNLITSCRDCNRGKSNKKLSDNSAIKTQRKQLDDLQKQRELTEMMIQWKRELMDIRETEVDVICQYIESLTGLATDDDDRKKIRNWIARFSFEEVYTATEISFAQYFKLNNNRTFWFAVDKIGGICYNRKKMREESAKQTY